MSSKGAIIVLLTCFLVHVLYCLDTPSYFVENDYSNTVLAIHISNGVCLLLFPLFGWMADVWFTRYQTIRASLIALTSSMAAVTVVLMIFITLFQLRFLTHHTWVVVVGSLIFISLITSIGMFEANAIQFGMDQLLEASSSQLSAFIHWYYWSMHLGQLLFFLVGIAVSFSFPASTFIKSGNDRYLQDLGITLLLTAGTSMVLVSLALLCYTARVTCTLRRRVEIP